jgi:hypothetical protein
MVLPQLESILPTNLRNAQRYEHKVNSAKDGVLFHQHFCEIFIANARLQFLHHAPYFGEFSTNVVAIKSIVSDLLGSMKSNWIEPKTGLGQVFNFKIDCFDDEHVLIYTEACPYLYLKTRPRFSPVSLSLSIGLHNGCIALAPKIPLFTSDVNTPLK